MSITAQHANMTIGAIAGSGEQAKGSTYSIARHFHGAQVFVIKVNVDQSLGPDLSDNIDT